MDLIKDENIKDLKEYYSGYCSKDGDNSIYFINGKLEASAYSYQIGSVGNVNINEKQTYELFLAMKKYFNE